MLGSRGPQRVRTVAKYRFFLYEGPYFLGAQAGSDKLVRKFN